MDLLKGNVKALYYKYLAAAFGSTFIASIYSIVDMAMVGKYHGPNGIAALAVVAPIWNIIYSLGLLMGIGGAVLFSSHLGKDTDSREANIYFSASLLGAALLATLSWLIIIFFDEVLLKFFGATGEILSLARLYIFPIKFVVPSFLFIQTLAAFLRNDKSPALATIAVLSGGIFNVIGDYYFVFVCDMGIQGAGVATAMGSVITLIMMLSHFLLKRNSLRFARCANLGSRLNSIVTIGFSTFFLDISMGILTILFNRQILAYIGADALAVYGVIINLSTFVQCCAYSVGQAAQPLISINYAAKQVSRVRQLLRSSFGSLAFLGIL